MLLFVVPLAYRFLQLGLASPTKAEGSRAQGSGFGVPRGSGFGVQRVQGLGFRVQRFRGVEGFEVS